LASRLERVGRLRPISKTCLICSKLAIRSVSWRGEYNGSAPAALDGEYRWFAFRIRPLVDASGKIVKWCGLNIVIEDRRRSEEVMQRAREDHYRSIADSIPALIAFMTPAGEVESVNRHALEYFGTAPPGLRNRAYRNQCGYVRREYCCD
jgi:PAS domain-containing protein